MNRIKMHAFLLDECMDARLIEFLKSRGYQAKHIVADYSAGISDTRVLAIAEVENYILITEDRDFGELIFRLHKSHSGIIYFRLGEYATLETKIERPDIPQLVR